MFHSPERDLDPWTHNKRHLNRFIRFCMADGGGQQTERETDRQTDRQTDDRPRYLFCSNKPHSHAMRATW